MKRWAGSRGHNPGGQHVQVVFVYEGRAQPCLVIVTRRVQTKRVSTDGNPEPHPVIPAQPVSASGTGSTGSATASDCCFLSVRRPTRVKFQYPCLAAVSQPDLPHSLSGFRRARLGLSDNRRLNHRIESICVNVGGSARNVKASSLPKTVLSVGAAIVLGGRESRPQGEGRQFVGRTQAKVAE